MAKRSFQPISRGSSDQPVEIETANVPDVVEVDLDGKDPHAFTIVVEDDTPPEDRGRPTQVRQPTEVTEDELRKYTPEAARRVKRLDFERHTERRGRETAERLAETAMNEAREARAELERLKAREGAAASVVGNAMLQRHETALSGAKARLQKAIEDGDAAAQADAQVEIGTLTSEITAIKQRLPRQAAPAEGGERQPQAQPAQVQQPQVQDPAQNPRLHPDVREWIAHNKAWFGQADYAQRTRSAITIEQDLRAENILPGSPDYIKKLDERLAVYYPDHQPFRAEAPHSQRREPEKAGGSDSQTRPGRPNAETEVTRESATSDVSASADPRTVRLTSTEVALAKRLNVPLQRYAAEKAAREARKGGA